MDAEKWAKLVGRWRLQLGVTIFVAATIPFNIAVGNKWLAMVLLPTVVTSAFTAGRLYAEYERFTGKRTMGRKLRPPGL